LDNPNNDWVGSPRFLPFQGPTHFDSYMLDREKK